MMLQILRVERHDGLPRYTVQKQLGGVFWAEDPLEAGAGELNADEALASRGSVDDVDNAPRCGEVGFCAARSVVGKRDSDFEIGPDGDVEMRDERSAAAA
jgi:hypothetical protein